MARYSATPRSGYEDETQQGARYSLCMKPERRSKATRKGGARARARSRPSKRRSEADAGVVDTRSDSKPAVVDTEYSSSDDGDHGSIYSSSESDGNSRARGVAEKKLKDLHDSDEVEDDGSLYVTEDEGGPDAAASAAAPALSLRGSLLRSRVREGSGSLCARGSESEDTGVRSRGSSNKAPRRHRRPHTRRRGSDHGADEDDGDAGRWRASTLASAAQEGRLAPPPAAPAEQRAPLPPLESQLLELPGGRAPIRVDPRQPNTVYVHPSGAFDLYARFYEEVCGMKRVEDPRRAGVVLGNEFELMRALASSGWAHFHPHARVLFLPGVVLLDDKAELAALLAGASYHPTTYVNEAPEAADLRGWWIDKPARGSSGRGLSIVRDPTAWKADGHVLQRYRDDPLLHRGRYKFDLRALALVTGDGRAMVYSDAVMRCCTMPYAPVGGARGGGRAPMREQDVDERAHLTNVSVQAKYDRTQSHVDLLSEHPELYDALMPRVRALVHDVLARWFSRVASDDEGGLAGKQPHRQRAAAPTTSPVVSARRKGGDDDAPVSSAPQQRDADTPARRPRSRRTRMEDGRDDGERASVVTSMSSAAQGFRIVGFDVLPLANGDVVFVEANYQPGLGRDGKLGHFYERALQEMLRCTVDPAWAAAKLVTVCPALAEFAHDAPDAGVQRRRRGAALTVAATSMLMSDACAATTLLPLLRGAHSKSDAGPRRTVDRWSDGGHMSPQFGVSPAPTWLPAAVERAAQRLPPRSVADIVRGPGATLVVGTYADARAAAECALLDPSDCAAGRREGELVAYGMVEQLPPAAVGMARNRARGTRARIADADSLRGLGVAEAGGRSRRDGEGMEVLRLLRGPWDGAGGSSSSCLCVITDELVGRAGASARRQHGSRRRVYGGARDGWTRDCAAAVICAFAADDTGRVRLDARGAVLVWQDGSTSAAASAAASELEVEAWTQVQEHASRELCAAWNLPRRSVSPSGTLASRAVECGVAVFARLRANDSMSAAVALPLRPSFADCEDALVLHHLLTYFRLSDLAHFCGTALASLCGESHARARSTPGLEGATQPAHTATDDLALARSRSTRHEREAKRRQDATWSYLSPTASAAASNYDDPIDTRKSSSGAGGVRDVRGVQAPVDVPWAQPVYMMDSFSPAPSTAAATMGAARSARYSHERALHGARVASRGTSRAQGSSQPLTQQRDSFRNYLGLRLTQPGRAHTGALRPTDPYAW